MGFRAKLFVVSMTLTLLVVLSSGVILERSLRAWIVSRVRVELERHAHTAALAVRAQPPPLTAADLDALALQLSQTTQTHVIFLGSQWQVLADSARGQGQAVAAPTKAQLERLIQGQLEPGEPEELAIALPLGRPDSPGYLYMTLPLRELSEVIERVRWLMIFAALLGLIAAIFMSGLAAHLMSRTLRALAQRAHELASGSQAEPHTRGEDDLGGLAVSITQLSRAMAESVEALARERDRFEAVVESMEETVLAVDEHHHITLINRAGMALFASQAQLLDQQVVGARVTDLLPIPALLPLLEQADRGTRSVAELTLPGPPEHVVMARVTPRKNHAGAVIVLHDVTALRRLERVRRDFVANVSHELRTPVSVIMLNSETLLQEGLSDPHHAMRFIQAMHRNAERLARLISDLLDISRLESGRFRLELEPISVFGAILRVMDVLDEKFEAKGQAFDMDVDMELLVYADAKALDQILYNLIDNASKYTPQGGSIMLRATRGADMMLPRRAGVLLEIMDDGPGLTPAQRARIFERFYRVDDGRSRDAGGTGLGLAIVKHLTVAMHGRVGVKPNSPQGSIFWVRLPEASPQDAVAVDIAKAVEIVEEGVSL